MQALTLLRVYISHKIYFYLPSSGGGGATAVPRTANLMDYAGQTLYMSEEVGLLMYR